MKFDTWFPTVIGKSYCPFISDIQSNYKKIIENYSGDENGFFNYPIHLNKDFKKLNEWVTAEVNKFGKEHNFAFKYEAKESWIWDYKVGSYQDFHAHAGFTLSTVFFLEGYTDDTHIFFKNPVEDMKNPMNFLPTQRTSFDPSLFNNFTYGTVDYPPETGMLLTWRSYIEHRVNPKRNMKKRIVFVYNFDATDRQ